MKNAMKKFFKSKCFPVKNGKGNVSVDSFICILYKMLFF